jgi:ATP phosphoribosyltransferase
VTYSSLENLSMAISSDPDQRPIRIGLPKGRFADYSRRVLGAFDIAATDSRQLAFPLPFAGAVAILAKARDIPKLISHGVLDVGVAPDEWIMETEAELQFDTRRNSFVKWGGPQWPNCRLAFLASARQQSEWPPPSTATVVTEFRSLANSLLSRIQPRVQILAVTGSTEGFIPTIADYGFECIETGKTCEENCLRELHVVRANLGLSIITKSTTNNLTTECAQKLVRVAKKVHHEASRTQSD